MSDRPVSFDFRHRRALVTGAASGIGRATVERLSRCGAEVIACDKNAAALESLKSASASGSLSIQICDVTDPASVDSAFAFAEGRGGAEIVIHAAGIVGPVGSVAESAIADWDAVIGVNLRGTYLVNRAAVVGMIRRNYGRIVNFGSIAGTEGPAGLAAYSASKAAVSLFTLALAKETAKQNIAVNCVAPAGVRTPMIDLGKGAEFEATITRRIARGRLAEADEAVSIALWLASDENSFTTGQTFNFAGARV